MGYNSDLAAVGTVSGAGHLPPGQSHSHSSSSTQQQTYPAECLSLFSGQWIPCKIARTYRTDDGVRIQSLGHASGAIPVYLRRPWNRIRRTIAVVVCEWAEK